MSVRGFCTQLSNSVTTEANITPDVMSVNSFITTLPYLSRYHTDCLTSSLSTDPDGDWTCPDCIVSPRHTGKLTKLVLVLFSLFVIRMSLIAKYKEFHLKKCNQCKEMRKVKVRFI